MKKSLKHMIAFAAVFCLIFAAVGCNSKTSYEYQAEANAIFVHNDGTITASYVETFNQANYSVDEVMVAGQNAVQAYNEQKAGISYFASSQLTADQKKNVILPVSIEASAEANGTLIVTMKYQTGDDYAAFNQYDIHDKGGTTVYTSKVETCGVELNGTYVKALGGDAILADDIKKQKDYTVVYVDYKTKIYTEHKIAYVSNNVSVTSDNCAETQDGQKSFVIFE